MLIFLAMGLLAVADEEQAAPAESPLSAEQLIEQERQRLANLREEERVRREREQQDKIARESYVPMLRQAQVSRSAVLMLRPFHQVVLAGQRFATEVVVFSDNTREADRVDVRIIYPPAHVRPLQIFVYPLSSHLDAERPPLHELGNGVLHFSAHLSRPLEIQGEVALFHVVWEAIEPTDVASLSLSHRSLGSSSLFLGEDDLLLASEDHSAAVVNAAVQITTLIGADRPGLRIAREFGRRIRSAADPSQPISLRMLVPEYEPVPGEEFTIDILLDNPDHLAFDEVRLAIGFDPTRAEVLDWDYRNWIRTGVNVFDGHARLRFPFNRHYRNEVDNQNGRIFYHMGFTTLMPRPSGSLVRIRARAVGENAVSSFTLFPPNQTQTWRTDVTGSGKMSLLAPDLGIASHEPEVAFR